MISSHDGYLRNNRKVTGVKSREKKLKCSSATSHTLVVDQQLIAPLLGLYEQLIALKVVSNLHAVGEYFENFDQLHDADVINLLGEAKLSIHSKV